MAKDKEPKLEKPVAKVEQAKLVSFPLAPGEIDTVEGPEGLVATIRASTLMTLVGGGHDMALFPNAEVKVPSGSFVITNTSDRHGTWEMFVDKAGEIAK
jgi:hypothetical protein